MTIKQKQALLAYLGYYDGSLDDIWGQQSQQATIDFQRDYMDKTAVDGIFGDATEKRILEVIASGEQPTKTEEPVVDILLPTVDWWKDIRYFTRAEFKCKCGGRYCDGYPAEMQEAVVKIADAAREHFGEPAYVISGLRCRQHNANEGGVANSQHMYGEAIDLKITGVSGEELLSFLQGYPGVRYAYKINDTNVHFDINKVGR